MFTARKHCNAHTAYSKFRTALELLETFDLATDAGDEEEYHNFLKRYQRTMGIALPLAETNTAKDNTEPTRIESSSACEDLVKKLEQMQRRRQEDERRRQEDERKRQEEDKEYYRQLDQIRLQLEKITPQGPANRR